MKTYIVKVAYKEYRVAASSEAVALSRVIKRYKADLKETNGRPLSKRVVGEGISIHIRRES